MGFVGISNMALGTIWVQKFYLSSRESFPDTVGCLSEFSSWSIISYTFYD